MAQLIVGNTYPHRARIKVLGGVWDKARRGWLVPDGVAGEVAALVGGTAPAVDSHGTACEGHPAGPEDLMGQTVYCDGSCAQPRHAARRRQGTGSRSTRFAGGAEVFTNVRGRCEDAPCCGCCS